MTEVKRRAPSGAEYIKGGTKPEHYPEHELPEFAFVGRSNAGKSTLINALTGRKALARTSGTPGRTQAIQFFSVGKTLVFADLPGYGFARAPSAVRKDFVPMVRTYLGKRKNLRGVVLIADIRRDPTPEEEELLDLFDRHSIPAILVLSKADKLSRNQRRKRVAEVSEAYGLDPEHFFPYSGLHRTGVDAIWDAILDLAEAPEGP
jgi:GTP-binding protein